MIITFSNSNISVICQPRCGHTRLSQFLKSPHQGFNQWRNSPCSAVVLRHPIERINSAIQNYRGLSHVLSMYDESEDKSQFLENLCLKNINWGSYVSEMVKLTRSEAREADIFKIHCLPYMHQIQYDDFKYINFEKLENYFPKYSDQYDPKLTSQIYNTTQRTLDVFPENRYFTELDLEREISLYNEFLETRKELTVDEWKELTA